MKRYLLSVVTLSILLIALFSCGTYQAAASVNEPTGEQLSQELLKALKNKQPAEKLIEQIATLEPEALRAELTTKDKQLAFWVNIYNGMMQYLLTSQPELWEDRNDLFGGERVTVAGELISPERIEHGIIRGGEAKLGLGYFPKLFQGKFERTFKIDGGDARVHFALNCGAIDCPPVEIFESATVDRRLDARSEIYLKKHTTVDKEKEVITTTPLVSWFKGDFRQFDGVDDTLVKFGAVTEDQKNWSRESKAYDWTLATNVYANE